MAATNANKTLVKDGPRPRGRPLKHLLNGGARRYDGRPAACELFDAMVDAYGKLHEWPQLTEVTGPRMQFRSKGSGEKFEVQVRVVRVPAVTRKSKTKGKQ